MPTTTWPSIRGLSLRLTKEDSCGVPVIGPKSQLVTDGFISIALSPQYEDGEETKQKNAAGKLCVNDKADDDLSGFEVEISFCGVDPDAINFVTASKVVVDREGNAVGNVFSGGLTAQADFGLEVWTDVPGAVCTGDKPHGYFLLPFLHGGRISDFTIEETLANFTLTTRTQDLGGLSWGVGPHDVMLHDGAAPEDDPVAGPLLVPLGKKDYLAMFQTLVAPPEVTNGAVALAP
jgi:hypothetical protein